jgi:hypothetical protein
MSYQNGQGLKIAWNKTNGAGETNFINYQDGGGDTCYTFWNTSPSIIPTLVFTIKNNAYILCSGVNNCPASAIEFCKNINQDVQTALNNTIKLNVSNVFTSAYTTIQNQLYAPDKCDTKNFTAKTANITDLQVNNLYVDGIIINGINSAYVGIGQGSIIFYSKVCNKYSISTVVNADASSKSFYFDINPTAYNSGQIIHFFNGNLDSSSRFTIYGTGVYWPSTGQTVANQQFLMGGNKYNSFYLTGFRSCTLIYVENNTWMGFYHTDQPPSDDYTSSATINYIEYTFPTAPTFPTIIY